MQNFTSTSFALSLADQMVAEGFAKEYGVSSYAAYLNLVDERSTAHLDAHMTRKVKATAGAQRHRARLKLENSGTVIIAVPLIDSHSGETFWAELDLRNWLRLMEMGAEGAWFFDRKGRDRPDGQVRTNAPVRSGTSNKNVTIARLITNAKPGQQARTLDRNPLNLRQDNLNLIGNPNTVEGKIGTATADSVALIREHQARRQALSGKGYGMNGAEEGQ